MYCWSCGHKNPDNNKFCGDCGQVQVRPPGVSSVSSENSGPTVTDDVKTANVKANDVKTNPLDRESAPPAGKDIDSAQEKFAPPTPVKPAPPEVLKETPRSLTSSPVAKPPATPPVIPPPGSGITPAPQRYVSTNPLIGESRVVKEKPLSPPVTVTPPQPASISTPPMTADVRLQPSVRSSTRISGPSFLGLSDAPDVSGPSEYLLEDEADSSSSTARSYIALALVLLFGVLIYKQWDTVSALGRDVMQRATATAPSTIASNTPPPEPSKETSAATSANNNAYHGLDEAKPESDHAPAEEKAPEKSAGAKNTDAGEGPATEATEMDSIKSARVEPVPAELRAETANSSSTKPVAKTLATREEAAPAAANYDDSQVESAQKYLQGRGVAQDCNRGVSLLRSAAAQPNPKAQIKLGALYATGHCVSQDRAEAYRWFAEARQLQPGNQWIDKNLSSLWSEMTPEERSRAQR